MILNKEFFFENVEKCGKIRLEINDVHHKEMNLIAQIYQAVFNRDSGEFRYAKDILYYKGGWPSEHTPARAESLAKHIFQSYLILSYIDQETELVDFLKEYGLSLTLIEGKESFYKKNLVGDCQWKLDGNRRAKVHQVWEELFPKDEIPSRPKQLLSFIMKKAMEKQKVICTLADQIKLEVAPVVEDQCNIKRKNFMDTVSMESRRQKDRDVSNDIIKKKDDATNAMETMNVFEKGKIKKYET